MNHPKGSQQAVRCKFVISQVQSGMMQSGMMSEIIELPIRFNTKVFKRLASLGENAWVSSNFFTLMTCSNFPQKTKGRNRAMLILGHTLIQLIELRI
ncbi:MAG: hypothetical protein ACI9CE_001114 [Flavobacterium sp.]|jgi:hypothetical protein